MIIDFIMTDINIGKQFLSFKSAVLNRKAELIIYMPQNMAVQGSVDLLLVNDGQDLETMQFENIIHGLCQKNMIKPLLVVGIKANNRIQDYGIAAQADYKQRGSNAAKYNIFILEELIP